MFGLAGAPWQVNVNSERLFPQWLYPSLERKVGTARREMRRFTCYGVLQGDELEKSRLMGSSSDRVRRRWRGNVLSPLSESFSCWQMSSWPFPSQTMNPLCFPAPVPFPQAACVVLCVHAQRACFLMWFSYMCIGMYLPKCMNITWGRQALRFLCSCQLNNQNGFSLQCHKQYICDVIYFIFKCTKCLSMFRRIRAWEVDAHQLSVPDWPVLQRLSWTLPAHQEDCAG